jgi:hypothetical protein
MHITLQLQRRYKSYNEIGGPTFAESSVAFFAGTPLSEGLTSENGSEPFTYFRIR